MLLRTEDLQARHAAQVPVETEREKTRLWCLDQLAQQRLIEDAFINPTNIAKQWGQALSPWQFFGHGGTGRVDFPGILAHVSRYFIVERDINPGKDNILHLYHVVPEKKTHITAFVEGVLPEFSLFNTKIEDVPADPYSFNNTVHVEDFPKAEWSGWKDGWKFDERDVRPGWMRIKKPWNEIRRGWRTILAYIVRSGLATPNQIERLVSDADNASWAIHMGRVKHRNIQSAW